MCGFGKLLSCYCLWFRGPLFDLKPFPSPCYLILFLPKKLSIRLISKQIPRYCTQHKRCVFLCRPPQGFAAGSPDFLTDIFPLLFLKLQSWVLSSLYLCKFILSFPIGRKSVPLLFLILGKLHRLPLRMHLKLLLFGGSKWKWRLHALTGKTSFYPSPQGQGWAQILTFDRSHSRNFVWPTDRKWFWSGV